MSKPTNESNIKGLKELLKHMRHPNHTKQYLQSKRSPNKAYNNSNSQSQRSLTKVASKIWNDDYTSSTTRIQADTQESVDRSERQLPLFSNTLSQYFEFNEESLLGSTTARDFGPKKQLEKSFSSANPLHIEINRQRTILQPSFMQNHGTMCYTELWGDKEKKKVIKKTRGNLKHIKLDIVSKTTADDFQIYQPEKLKEKMYLSKKISQINDKTATSTSIPMSKTKMQALQYKHIQAELNNFVRDAKRPTESASSKMRGFKHMRDKSTVKQEQRDKKILYFNQPNHDNDQKLRLLDLTQRQREESLKKVQQLQILTDRKSKQTSLSERRIQQITRSVEKTPIKMKNTPSYLSTAQSSTKQSGSPLKSRMLKPTKPQFDIGKKNFNLLLKKYSESGQK